MTAHSHRTELEWTYHPADLFEEPYAVNTKDYDLTFDGGRGLATLISPQNVVDAVLERNITAHVQNVLLARQLQIRRSYEVQGPRIYQHVDGKKHVTVRVGSATMNISLGRADIRVTSAVGDMIRDTRAERIAADTAGLDLVVAKAMRVPPLRGLLESYSRSILDPDDEFVHLYEVRDALSAYYGGDDAARAALRIAKSEWQTLGLIANVAPLEQGRHRGKHPVGRRRATEAELEQVRELVRRWIARFAQTV